MSYPLGGGMAKLSRAPIMLHHVSMHINMHPSGPCLPASLGCGTTQLEHTCACTARVLCGMVCAWPTSFSNLVHRIKYFE